MFDILFPLFEITNGKKSENGKKYRSLAVSVGGERDEQMFQQYYYVFFVFPNKLFIHFSIIVEFPFVSLIYSAFVYFTVCVSIFVVRNTCKY